MTFLTATLSISLEERSCYPFAYRTRVAHALISVPPIAVGLVSATTELGGTLGDLSYDQLSPPPLLSDMKKSTVLRG